MNTGGVDLVLDAHEAAACSASCRVSAATIATGSPKYFVSPTARTGRSCNWGPEPRHGLRQVIGRHHEPTPGSASAADASTEMIRAARSRA